MAHEERPTGAWQGSFYEARRYFKFWAAFFTGPLAWTIQLLLGYALVPFACKGPHLPLNVLSVLAAAVTLGAAVTSYREWRRARAGDLAVIGRHDEGVAPFMTYAGFVTGTAFLALIVLTGAAMALLDPCRIR